MTLASKQPIVTVPILNDRFLLERHNDLEFPFVSGPRSLAPWRWVIIALVAVSMLIVGLLIPVTTYTQYAGVSILPFVLPLTVLAVLCGTGWTSWFHRIRLKDIATIFWYTAMAKIVTGIASLIVTAIHPPNDHPISKSIQQEATQADWFGILKLNGLMTLGLPGEEMFAIIPFVAIIAILYRRFNVSRKTAIIVALVVTALAFGAIHLPVYRYDYLEAFLIIGTARVVITLSFLKTKNLWVPIGTHILFDWTASLSAIIIGIVFT